MSDIDININITNNIVTEDVSFFFFFFFVKYE